MAFCEFCLINERNEFEIDSKELKEKAPILIKYLENNDEKKLECLFAIYDLVVKLNNSPSKLKLKDKRFN